MPEAHDITQLLSRAQHGDTEALGRLIPLVYAELRAMAHQQRHRRGGGDTLNTTAVVHEAYEKLARSGGEYADRKHFFRVAARAMRDVLVDHARAQNRKKRGGGIQPLVLNESLVVPPEQAGQLLALDEALTLLNDLDTRQAEVVQLRYFIGLTVPEAADVLGLSEATVKRDWTVARAWLHHALSDAA